MTDWQAQAIRMVWFGSGLESVGADQIFAKAFSLEAETVQRNRIPNPANPFWSTANGRLDERVGAEIQIQPGRVDVILMPSDAREAPALGMDLSAGFQHYDKIAVALSSLGPALRVATIIELINHQPDQRHATVEALKLFGYANIESDVLDLSLQFNRRRDFQSVSNQTMNRLVRWGVGNSQHFRVEIGAVPTGTSFGSVSFVTSVFVDLNNAPTTPLDFDQQMAMYKEMGAELIRIAADPSVERL